MRTSLNFTAPTNTDQLPPALHIKKTPPRKAYLLGGVFVLVVPKPESTPLLSGFLQVAWGAYDGEVGLCGLLGHWFVPFWGYFSAPEGCLKYPVGYCTLVLLKSSQRQDIHRYGRDCWALVVRDDHDMCCDRQHLGAQLEGNKHGK